MTDLPEIETTDDMPAWAREIERLCEEARRQPPAEGDPLPYWHEEK